MLCNKYYYSLITFFPYTVLVLIHSFIVYTVLFILIFLLFLFVNSHQFHSSSSGVTESLFGGGGAKGGRSLSRGGGKRTASQLKGTQSKVKWRGGGGQCGAHGVNWRGNNQPPQAPTVTPLTQLGNLPCTFSSEKMCFRA